MGWEGGGGIIDIFSYIFEQEVELFVKNSLRNLIRFYLKVLVFFGVIFIWKWLYLFFL